MAISATAAMLLVAVLGAETSQGPVRPFESQVSLTPETKIDGLVLAQLKRQGITPAYVCSDGVFVRRLYLDVLGTLPTAAEARQFLQDRSPEKRRILINRLLDREERADYLAMKWSDLLRIKAEFPINLWPHAAQAYHHWIRTSLQENKSYDRFVRELLTTSGSNFRVPPVNFYRTVQSRQPQALAQAVALTFLGTRAEKWPAERLSGMAAFFSKIGYKATAEWKEEIVFFDPAANGATATQDAAFPDGTAVRLSADRDPREVFADWLLEAKNPYFARCMANRVWYWLLGRGIIHQPDDIRTDNPPSNPALLAYLEREFVAAGFDLKQLYRLILNSNTYQLSSIARGNRNQAEAAFACYPLRRLEAEVLIDAICQVTGTTEKYTSAIPEPYSFLPQGYRSVTLPDGSITNSFLETFGRPPRDTGLESERNNRITAAQRLHLLNSNHIQHKLEQSAKIQQLLQTREPPREIVAGVYLLILSRLPTDEELRAVQSYAGWEGRRRREALIDLAWALINSSEFIYRH